MSEGTKIVSRNTAERSHERNVIISVISNHLEDLYNLQSQCHTLGHEYMQYDAKITTCESILTRVRTAYRVMEEEAND